MYKREYILIVFIIGCKNLCHLITDIFIVDNFDLYHLFIFRTMGGDFRLIYIIIVYYIGSGMNSLGLSDRVRWDFSNYCAIFWYIFKNNIIGKLVFALLNMSLLYTYTIIILMINPFIYYKSHLYSLIPWFASYRSYMWFIL